MGLTPSSAGLADLPYRSSVTRRDTTPNAFRSVPDPTSHPVRTFEIAALRKDGTRHISQVKVPAIPLFEKAFSAFARGTLIQTSFGECAVEDLQPGDMINTTSGKPCKLLWIGSGTFVPADAGYRTSLVRVMADTFGMGRPDSFLTLGPHARILQTPPHLRGQIGAASLLSPISDFVDGVNVIEITPPTPVNLFHLVLERHATIRAGGLECETFHPGGQAVREVSHSLRDLFLSMFPHISMVSDFGPLAHPRAPDPSSSSNSSL
ncbi:MAG: Hint domain-containing protein [Aliishimia sp.]